MGVTCRRIGLFSPGAAAVRALYHAAFPPHERMPFFLMRLLGQADPRTDLLAFYDGEELCGFAHLAGVGQTEFLMFFAGPEALRSRGYGTRIHDQLAARHPSRPSGVHRAGCSRRAARRRPRPTARLLPARAFRAFFLIYSNCTLCPRVWRV